MRGIFSRLIYGVFVMFTIAFLAWFLLSWASVLASQMDGTVPHWNLFWLITRL